MSAEKPNLGSPEMDRRPKIDETQEVAPDLITSSPAEVQKAVDKLNDARIPVRRMRKRMKLDAERAERNAKAAYGDEPPPWLRHG